MHKVFVFFAVLLLSGFLFGDNTVRVGDVSSLGRSSVSVWADGSGEVGVSLFPGRGFTLTSSGIQEVQARLRAFVEVDKEAKALPVEFYGRLGTVPVVPLFPQHCSLFFVASISPTEGNALGLRLVNYDTGGWGEEKTVYLTVEEVRSLSEVLYRATDKDQEIRNAVSALQEKALADF